MDKETFKYKCCARCTIRIKLTDKEKITVKLKHGSWEVEITCPEDRVKQTVENVISGIDTNTSLKRGYHYDKTSISHSLKDLVRENILTRNGSMRNYRYVQKRPPVA